MANIMVCIWQQKRLKESYLENNFGNVTGDLYKSDEGSLQYKGDDPELLKLNR